MARFKPTKDPDPIRVSQWMGINEAFGETGLSVGEALRQVNYRITKDYKLQKRPGHNTFIDYENTKAIRGLWYGTIGSKEVLISCNDGKVYEYNFDTQINTQIGTMTDNNISIIYFQSLLLFFDGVQTKQYNGTTFQNLVAYEPTIFVGSAPTGGGTPNEPINLLTGAKKQAFVGNGSATTYVLAETNLDADPITVLIDGVTKTEGTHFTANRTAANGATINFSAGTSPHGAPSNLASVIPRWVKVAAGNADLVHKNRFVMAYGPGNDTALFLWGNPDQPNRRMWSDSLNPGYFPATFFTLIGSNQFAITDIKSVYDRQIIFKEDRTHYSYAEFQSVSGSYDYPVYDLNEKVGNIAFGQVQIVENSPISIKGQSWWQWTSTNVEDERNAQSISERLRRSLAELDLSTAVTFDYQSQKEYWCCVDNIVYIWNYGNNTMYTYNNISANCFADANNSVYYGTQGTIEKMEGLNDNDIEIVAQVDTGFNSYGAIQMVKSSDTIYIGLLPDSRTSVTVYFKTNKKTDWKKLNKKAEYALLDFDDIDFDDFTFLTNRNPQTFGLPFSSGDYTYIQFRLENAELDETCTILDFLVSCETQGEVL